jgi:hypothetical protein
LFDLYFERKQSNAMHNGASGGGALLPPSTRGKMALPAGRLSRQRAVSIYNAL